MQHYDYQYTVIYDTIINVARKQHRKRGHIMSEKELIIFYKNQIDWYKRQIEWSNRHLENLNREIKREKYKWGYSVYGERCLRDRSKEYRDRQKLRKNVKKYEKLLSEMVAKK